MATCWPTVLAVAVTLAVCLQSSDAHTLLKVRISPGAGGPAGTAGARNTARGPCAPAPPPRGEGPRPPPPQRFPPHVRPPSLPPRAGALARSRPGPPPG